MKGLKTITLSQELTHKASLYFSEKEPPWFEEKIKEEEYLKRHFSRILVAQGIGDSECPSNPEWAAFSVAGGIIAALTGKYIVPPDPEPYAWHDNMERFVWEVVWKAVEEENNKLDRTFCALTLWLFLPRRHYAPPDHPYYMSNFVQQWQGRNYASTIMRSVTSLSSVCIEDAKEHFGQLPESLAHSIQEVAEHIPVMLKIVNECVRRRYRY